MLWNSGPLSATALICLISTALARAAAPSGTVTVVPEIRAHDRSSVISQLSPGASFGGGRGRADVEMRWHGSGVNAVATGRASLRDGDRARYTGLVNELYWDGQVLGQHVTLGRKIMSWDVGFAFRPLDVLQRDDRRVLFASTYEGVDVLAWERFGEASAWTLAYANPAAGTGAVPRDDESLAARYYRRIDALDLYVIGRASERLGLESGLAASIVASEAVEMHGSLRYQQKLLRPLLDDRSEQLSPPAALTVTARRDVVAALVGGTWAHRSGFSVLGEWWYDPAAHSADE